MFFSSERQNYFKEQNHSVFALLLTRATTCKRGAKKKGEVEFSSLAKEI